MTTPPRTPGKRGRLPVKPPEQRFPLRYLHEYAPAPLPAPAYPVDVTGGIGDQDWRMLGNGPDPTCTVAPYGVGDCGFAAREHLKMAKAAGYGETEQWESSDALVTEYLAYDHGEDIGVNLADVLLAWYKAGKILAFAPVDHSDPAQVDAAMQAFKGVYAGVNLTDDADQLFSAGQPWTTAGGQQPDPYDGHCILKVYADGHDLDGWITWGAKQLSTRDWSKVCVTEAWAVITSEDDAAKLGDGYARLVADIEALHGTAPASATPPLPPADAPSWFVTAYADLVRWLEASLRHLPRF